MLVNKNYYNLIFNEYRYKKILLCLPQGNVGDQLIWESCIQLFLYNNIKYDILSISSLNINEDLNTLKYKNYAAVFWGGGGNMGTLYNANYVFRKQITDKTKECNLKFIILPQSWTSIDDVEADTYYAREYKSIEIYEPRAIFYHDLALSYELPQYIRDKICKPTQKIGYFFRTDREKTDLISIHNMYDPANRCRTYEDYILLASNFEEIHTNRLHFAICGLYLNKSIKLYANSYFKNEAIYESSLKQFSNIEFIST